jgi:hypothetical protein
VSIHCDVILQWTATPEQLTTLGAALWRWCNRTAGNTGIYQYLDNQALADLIAGKLPVSSHTPQQAEPRGVHFRVQDETSHDRQATIDSLRHSIPAAARLLEAEHVSCNKRPALLVRSSLCSLR